MARDLIDLHIHVGGAVAPHVLWSIAHQQGFKLPVKGYWEFVDLITSKPSKTGGLEDYLKIMHTWTEKIQSSPSAIERSVYEVIGKEYRGSRVTQIELKFNPAKRNLNSELDLDHIIHAALRGMDRATLEYGVKAGLIFCLAREFDLSLNSIVVDKAIKYRARGVVGIDLAGTETDALELKPEVVARYQALFERAQKAGLKTTVHTGETAGTGAEGVIAVVEKLKPNRIGHGIRAAYDEAAMKLLRERDIVLELCPTSNLHTRAVESLKELKHIVRTFWDRKVKVTINTDGPYLLETDMRKEIELVEQHEILSSQEVDQTLAWARQYSFIPGVSVYKTLLRPLLFLLPAETAHHFGLWALRLLAAIPILCRVIRARALRPRGVDLSAALGPLPLPHPLTLAAGFDKDAVAVRALFGLGFAAVEVGTVTPRAQPGNPTPRMFRLPEHAALINRLGFNNQGVDAAAARVASLAERPGPVGANLGKNKDTPIDRAVDDYVACAQKLAPVSDYVVVNASSPNTPNLRQLQEPQALQTLLRAVKAAVGDKPMFLKIAPDLSFEAVDEIVDVAIAAGATGLIATNTTVERPVRHPRAAEAGGLSGAPLSDRSTQILARAAARAAGRLSMIGSGGAMTAADVYRKIRAGAQAVQLYTGFIYGGPFAVGSLLSELAELLKRDGFTALAQAVGADLKRT